MISDSQHNQRGGYDDEGNIILPETGTPGSAGTFRKPLWTNIDEQNDLNEATFQKVEGSRISRNKTVEDPPTKIWKDARKKIGGVTQDFFKEGAKQYKWSIKAALKGMRSSLDSGQYGIDHIWGFLAQPVWVLNRKRHKAKQYSRFSLFLLDTVRFGGTFAILFVTLFVSLNYQSFWKISQSYINPIRRAQSSIITNANTDNILAQKLLRSPSLATAGGSKGDLLSYLPEVGPPENRIIIPRLDLNIPLVTPSYKALLSEDWDQLEEDIQDALQMGVVHYPGTARPGQAGNFFVTGHSSYYPWADGKYKTVFARLQDLDVGDEYWVYYGGDKYRYIVRTKKEVKPTNVDVLDQPVSKRMATLMTCSPVGTTLRRLILSSEEVDPDTGIAMHVGEQHKRTEPKINVGALPI
ncbi:MAG: sortase [bacterium]|nr:sortase [bacterium]